MSVVYFPGDVVVVATPIEPLMGGNLTVLCNNTDPDSFEFVDWLDPNGDFFIGSKFVFVLQQS